MKNRPALDYIIQSAFASRWLGGEFKPKAEINKTLELIDEWRKRLQNTFWFMRNLNEFVVREANKERGCDGRL